MGGAEEGDTLAAGQRPTLEELAEDGVRGDLEFELVESPRWGSGCCVDGLARNLGVEAVVWEVQATVEGSINNIWEAVATPVDDGDTRFSGVSWNAELQPGASATFGFCAEL